MKGEIMKFSELNPGAGCYLVHRIGWTGTDTYYTGERADWSTLTRDSALVFRHVGDAEKAASILTTLTVGNDWQTVWAEREHDEPEVKKAVKTGVCIEVAEDGTTHAEEFRLSDGRTMTVTYVTKPDPVKAACVAAIRGWYSCDSAILRKAAMDLIDKEAKS